MEVRPFSCYGYKSKGLVKVWCEGDFCRRKEGLYLGGHKDEAQTGKGASSNQFFRCTSPCCSGRPFVLAEEGGSIFDSGSAFERHAGNSTQKKWSCSIKAVPEGEDSRTIGSWLHATGLAKARRLGALKGHTIWILWPLENAFFKGTVTGLDLATGLHHVNYDDGDQEEVRLFTESYHLKKKPSQVERQPSNRQAGQAAAIHPDGETGERESAPNMTPSPHKSFASRGPKTNIQSLCKLSKCDQKARLADAMLGKSSVQQPWVPSSSKAENTHAKSSLKAAAKLDGGFRMDGMKASLQASPADEVASHAESAEAVVAVKGADASDESSSESELEPESSSGRDRGHASKQGLADASAAIDRFLLAKPELGNRCAGDREASPQHVNPVQVVLSSRADLSRPPEAEAQPTGNTGLRSLPEAGAQPKSNRAVAAADSHSVISLISSMETSCAGGLSCNDELSGNDETGSDDDVEIVGLGRGVPAAGAKAQAPHDSSAPPVSRSKRRVPTAGGSINSQPHSLAPAVKHGSPAAGASAQLPHARSAQAINAGLVANLEGDSENEIEIEASDDEAVHGSLPLPAGTTLTSPEPSSTPTVSNGLNGLAEEQSFSQTEHIQVLLKPRTAMCVIRQGSVDWVSAFQFRRLHLSRVSRCTVKSWEAKEVGRRSATCEEVGFLVAKGVYERNPSGAMLLTVGAACNLLRRSKAPAATITSVQGLLGAKPMTAAEISSLAAVDVVLRNDGNGSSDEEGVDINGVPLVSIAHRKARTVTALQKASEDSAAALQRPNHESLAHHTGGQAPGESSSPLDWRASQVGCIHVKLEGPGIPAAPVAIVREIGTDWLTPAQLWSLLLSAMPYGSFRWQVRKIMGRRDATDAEKRFLADSGVWAQKPSRATLLSVQAACSLLQRTSAPAAKVAAVQALRQAHALSPAELKQLPRIVPVQHGRALTSSKQFGGTNASLSDDDGGTDIGGEDDVSDEDNADSDRDAPLATITDRKDPAAAAMQSPAGSSAKARAHVKGASPGFGPPRAGRASPRHQSGSKDPRSRISLLWHQRASEAGHILVWLEGAGIPTTAVALFREQGTDWLSSGQLWSLLLHKMPYESFWARLEKEAHRKLATTAERQFLADSGVFAQRPDRQTLLSLQAACDVLKSLGALAAQIAVVQQLQGAPALSYPQLKKLLRGSPVQISHDLSRDEHIGTMNALLRHDDDKSDDFSGKDDSNDEDSDSGPLPNIRERRTPAAAALQIPADSSAAAKACPKGASPNGGLPQAGHASPSHHTGGGAAGGDSLPEEGRASKAWHIHVRLEGPGIPKVALAMIRDGGGDWLSSRQVWSCLPSHTELKTHRWRVSKEGNTRRATDAERQFLADSRVFVSKPSQASLLSVEAVCVVLKRANLPAAQIAAVQKLQGAAALSPAQLGYMSRVSPTRPRQAPERSVQLEAAHKEEAQQELNQAGRQPASAAPVGAKAGPPANGSTPDVQRHAYGGTNGASLGQLKQGLSTVKAQWSSHSSDSESQEEGLPEDSHGDEADSEGQPTQADLHTALKTDFGVASPSGRAAVSTAAHGPALANQDRVSSQGLGQQTAAATKHASSSMDGPKTPVGALKDRSANGRKRSTAEATGASALGPSASKRPKTADAAGIPKQKAHAAMRPWAKPQQRAIVTARKGQCKEHLKALKVIKPAEEEDLPVHGSSAARARARAEKVRPLPYGMTTADCPPTPPVVDDAETVSQQEDLVENIFSREVFAEHKRRCSAVKGMPWDQGTISEAFLLRVNPAQKQWTEKLRDSVVDQIVRWLALSPERKKQYMAARTRTVDMTDLRHPAYRRFIDVTGPLGLRDKERALQFCMDMKDWTLVGEYCGVWNKQASDKDEEGDTSGIDGDPLKLGALLHDKVSELGYTNASASPSFADALRIKWRDALELDPSRAHNQLCLINDFRNVPGAPDLGNVLWLEVEDSRTLRPHLFIFTGIDVKAGDEVLLDYGEEYHEAMVAPLKRAELLVATQPEAVAAHRALKAALRQRDDEHARKEKEAEEERAHLKAQAEKERAKAALLEHDLAQAHKNARRIEEELKAEKACVAATLEENRSTSPGPADQALALVKNEAQSSESAHGDLVVQLRQKDNRISCLTDTAERACESAGASLARVQQLEAALQEREAELQLERREHQAMREMHHETCVRSADEIHRLSTVGKEFERKAAQVAEVEKYMVPQSMTLDDVLATARTTPMQIVPVGRPYEAHSHLPDAPRPAVRLLGSASGYSNPAPGYFDPVEGHTPQKEPERSLWDPCRSKNRKRSASHEVERDAKRGDVTEHSSKTGHHHRPERRDRHARTHHSANPHRHDAGRSGHHDSHRHHRATSGRNESGLALDRQHRESAGRDERHSSADWQLEASARHYEKTRPADRHYRPHDGRDVGHRSISRHRADKHHMHSFGRSLSRMEDRPQQVHVAEGTGMISAGLGSIRHTVSAEHLHH